MDAVATQGRGATSNRHPCTGVSEDVVILQHPLPVLVNEDTYLAIMDAVATQARIGTALDSNTHHTLAGDITSIQFQSPLCDIYTVPIPAPYLSQGQVSHSAHRCLEQ